jgi:pimeloyl-ACP methyl ester carboxylesterase
MEVRPFRIDVPDETLRDLRDRLDRTRWPDAIAGSGWEYGADLATLRGIVDAWRTVYDWRAQEAALNRFRQFRAEVGGIGIHFVHEKGKGPDPFPLILTHGWPGSFAEMLKLVPLLVDPAAHGGDPTDAFDVVVPSLPGYGFSDRPASRGMSTFRIAEIWADLMAGLGYSRYGAQGGDWGASVTTVLALQHPDRLAGIHLNYIPGSYLPHRGPGNPQLTEAEKEFLASKERWYAGEGGYAHVQATRPDLLGIGLNDSPAGLAAWILEKFRAWADCDGDLEKRFSRDELLTHVMIYWVTGTITSSCRLYYEASRRPLRLGPGERVRVPCGVAAFPKEAPFPPREWVERGYDVTRWTPMPRGGHFAALEEPDLLAADLRAFFRPLRSRGGPRAPSTS